MRTSLCQNIQGKTVKLYQHSPTQHFRENFFNCTDLRRYITGPEEYLGLCIQSEQKSLSVSPACTTILYGVLQPVRVSGATPAFLCVQRMQMACVKSNAGLDIIAKANFAILAAKSSKVLPVWCAMEKAVVRNVRRAMVQIGAKCVSTIHGATARHHAHNALSRPTVRHARPRTEHAHCASWETLSIALEAYAHRAQATRSATMD